MIDARIRKRYAAAPDSVPFELDIHLRTDARVTALFGPSGAGKTLTLDVIAGFVRPDEGRILVGNTLLFDRAANVWLRPQERLCGYVFQNYALFPHMTLRENLDFAAARLPRLERRKRIGELLESFHLDAMTGRKPHELSGGQKQRASVARALLASPRVLLLDEPSRGLDPFLRAELYGLLAEVRDRYRIPILLVTHDLEECFELADSMVVFEGGKIVQSGVPFDVLDHPASLDVARLFDRHNIIPAEIVALDPQRQTSRLRCFPDMEDSFEITAPYCQGKLLGARVQFIARVDRLAAIPRDRGGVPLDLAHVTQRSASVRMRFSHGVTVEMPARHYESHRYQKQWSVEFPMDALRVIETPRAVKS